MILTLADREHLRSLIVKHIENLLDDILLGDLTEQELIEIKENSIKDLHEAILDFDPKE